MESEQRSIRVDILPTMNGQDSNCSRHGRGRWRDRGVAGAVTLSSCEMPSPGGLSLNEAERLLRLPGRLARAAAGSNHRHKMKALIAVLKAKDAGRRGNQDRRTPR